MTWTRHDRHGTVAELHGLVPQPLDAVAELWSMYPSAPALVVGSSQHLGDDVLDRAGALGLDVVRRRSGGTAVVIVPGDVVWIDLVVPRQHPWWQADIRGQMRAAGYAWQQALGVAGRPGRVHVGGMIAGTPAEICWAGVGPGEVLDGGAKLVGLSQRRTAGWVRVQGMVHRRWPGETYRALFGIAGAAAERPTVRLADLAEHVLTALGR